MFTNFFRSILRKWMKRWNSVGSRRSFYTNQCGDLYTRSIVYALTCYKTPTESLSLGAAYGEKGILHCLVEIRQIWTCAKSGDNDNKTSLCVTRLVSLTFLLKLYRWFGVRPMLWVFLILYDVALLLVVSSSTVNATYTMHVVDQWIKQSEAIRCDVLLYNVWRFNSPRSSIIWSSLQ